MAAPTRKRRPAVKPPNLAIDGFREDMSQFLNNYLLQPDTDIARRFRLENFVEHWERYNFGYVFGGMQTTYGGLSETYQFGEKCFREALQQCIKPTDCVGRVAGLYLLYSLYISRPLSCSAKIRIHPVTEMAPLITFVQLLLNHKHYDAVFTFLDLWEQKAFRYACAATEMGYHTMRSRPFRDDRSVHSYTPTIPSILASDTMMNVLYWDKEYHSQKSAIQIVAEPVNDPDTGLPLDLNMSASFHDKLTQISLEYDQRIAQLEASRSSGSTLHVGGQSALATPVASSDNHSSVEEESIGAKRRRLRSGMVQTQK